MAQLPVLFCPPLVHVLLELSALAHTIRFTFLPALIQGCISLSTKVKSYCCGALGPWSTLLHWTWKLAPDTVLLFIRYCLMLGSPAAPDGTSTFIDTGTEFDGGVCAVEGALEPPPPQPARHRHTEIGNAAAGNFIVSAFQARIDFFNALQNTPLSKKLRGLNKMNSVCGSDARRAGSQRTYATVMLYPLQT